MFVLPGYVGNDKKGARPELRASAFRGPQIRGAWPFSDRVSVVNDLAQPGNRLTALNAPTWEYVPGIGWGMKLVRASSQWLNIGGGTNSTDVEGLDITTGGLGILLVCRVDEVPSTVTTWGVVTKNKASSGAPTNAPYVLQIEYTGSAVVWNWTVCDAASTNVTVRSPAGFPITAGSIWTVCCSWTPGQELRIIANQTVRGVNTTSIPTALGNSDRGLNVGQRSTGESRFASVTLFGLAILNYPFSFGEMIEFGSQPFRWLRPASLVEATGYVDNFVPVYPAIDLADSYGFWTLGTPAAPARLAAVGNISEVDLSWSPGDDTATSYTIERSIGNNTGWTLLTTTGAVTSYADNAVTPGVLYYYRIQAHGPRGASDYSNEASATPLAPGSKSGVAFRIIHHAHG